MFQLPPSVNKPHSRPNIQTVHLLIADVSSHHSSYSPLLVLTQTCQRKATCHLYNPPLIASSLPPEILLKIILYLLFSHASALARTSKTLYIILNHELYTQCKHINWYPLSSTTNTHTLQRCLEANAPIDFHWPDGIDSGTLYLAPGWRPLRQAIDKYLVGVVKWLLAHGADPNETSEEKRLLSFREPPLALAFRRGHGSVEKALPAREMLFALCEAGADLTKVELGAAEERRLKPCDLMEVISVCIGGSEINDSGMK
ncbi:uncharacterized protein FTOL_05271 [Fusarium torulosum]|uniref:F-box domain-containing protein n=1 Tax=Fusarium torulosum TaxID=33205 RepID=A0AAE8SGZ4_9HYPO|nr:uncharacterized protein FTOL_05271 [Fusarium torulosum]